MTGARAWRILARSAVPGVVGALVGAVITTTSPARADDRAGEKDACATAAEDAQQLRMEAKLKAARERLLVCSRPGCPPAVLRDCSQWMNEVTALMPSVVLGARDAQGRDVLGAQVSIDGAVVAAGLDGRAIEVDPGAHTFRFEAGGRAVDVAVLIREGEKGRAVTGTLDTPAAAPAGSPPPDPPSTHGAHGAVSPWTWVLGGVGLVAIGVGAALELSVNAEASHLQGTCGHDCPRSQTDPLVLEQQVLGPIAFGVGALGLGAATYLLFATPTPGGAVAGVAGRF